VKDYHIRIDDAVRDAIERQAGKERRAGARVVEEAVALYVSLWARSEKERGGTAKLIAMADGALAQVKTGVQ